MTQDLLPARTEPADLGAPARRQRRHRSPPRLRLLDTLVLAGLGLTAVIAQAQTPVNLVLDTGNNSALPARVTNSGAPIVRVGPSNPVAFFNNVQIRYLGTDTVAPLVGNPLASGQVPVATVARFIVLGDLNLAEGQRIDGIGPNLIRLEVGNNANLARGSVIDVSGEGRIAGAGGGWGGIPNGSPMPSVFAKIPIIGGGGTTFSSSAGGAGGLAAGNSSNIHGLPGATPGGLEYIRFNRSVVAYDTPEWAALFSSVAGGAGQAGQGNVAVAAGGGGQVYRGYAPFDSIDPGLVELTLAASGTGGGGGQAGSRSGPLDLVGTPAENGGNGQAGGNGIHGFNGLNAAPIQSLANPTIISLRGGNGGGAGATGGAGLPGGHGGAGGGGGASPPFLFTNLRGAGGGGGNGGIAGEGGAAGLGGQGGGGGGGIQIVVRGHLNVAANAGFNASGGMGLTGGAGGQGLAGGAGFPGANSSGGNGGNGGNGGTGGNGGNGGAGAGGTGGVVQVAASSLSFNGSISTRGGFSGDFNRSAEGESYIHAYSGASASLSTPFYFGARAAGSNPYRSFVDMTLSDGTPAGLSPNMPSIVGGAAPYGLLAGETAASGAPPLTVAEGVKLFAELAAPPVPGRLRVGAVTRVSAEWIGLGFGIPGYDRNNTQEVLLFSAFGRDVAQPALRAVDPAHDVPLGTYYPVAPVALQHGKGWRNDPSTTPSAVAPTDLAALPAYATFAMYVSGAPQVTAAFTPYTAQRSFTGMPTPAGNFGAPGTSTIFLEDNGLLRLGVTPRSGDSGATGTVTSTRETTGNFDNPVLVYARAGGDNRIRAQVHGIGNDGTATSGQVAIRTLQRPEGVVLQPGPLFTQATETFSQVGVGQTWDTASYALQTKGLALGTRQRVAEIDFTPDYDDTTRTITAPVDAMVFGPTPRLQGAGTSGNSFTFATIQAGTAVTSRFSLQNADVLSSGGFLWELVIRAQPELIRLTVLGYELVDTAGVFTVNGLGNAPLPFALDGNQTAPVDIRFSPTSAGSYTATLRFLTDMNAPLGQAGDYYTVSLFATAVDEPPALLLLLGGGLALWLRRRVQRPAA